MIGEYIITQHRKVLDFTKAGNLLNIFNKSTDFYDYSINMLYKIM